MKTLYTDASFDWTHTQATSENVVRGKIAIADGDTLKKVEQVVIGKVEGLKQYINIFELIAIARAVELAYDMDIPDKQLEIFTDSQVAMWWARNGIKNKEIITDAHSHTLDYLKRMMLDFEGAITFNFVPRGHNPAGILLQAELDSGKKPHEVNCLRCNNNGCPACDGTKGSKYNPEPY